MSWTRLLSAMVASAMLLSAGAEAQQRSGKGATSQDSVWPPGVYDLSGAGIVAATPGAVGPACTPKPAKTGEGACVKGSKTVDYADGCGGVTQATEACTVEKPRWTVVALCPRVNFSFQGQGGMWYVPRTIQGCKGDGCPTDLRSCTISSYGPGNAEVLAIGTVKDSCPSQISSNDEKTLCPESYTEQNKNWMY